GHVRARAGHGRPRRGGVDRDRGRSRRGSGEGDPRRRSIRTPRAVPVTPARRGRGRGARGAHPARSHGRARPCALPRVRQPAQGCRAERDPDRRARPRARAARSLSRVDVGMLGRFFGRRTGGNWRAPADELAFAAGAGFDTVQIRSDRPGELEDELGIAPAELGALYDDLGVEPVLEMLVRHDGERGAFARALRANLPAIEAAGFLRVHVHPVGPRDAAPLLAADLAEALAVAEDAGRIFGVEHNAPGHRLLVEPEEVEAVLEAVPGLGLVWDVNHTKTEHLDRFLAL